MLTCVNLPALFLAANTADVDGIGTKSVIGAVLTLEDVFPSNARPVTGSVFVHFHANGVVLTKVADEWGVLNLGVVVVVVVGAAAAAAAAAVVVFVVIAIVAAVVRVVVLAIVAAILRVVVLLIDTIFTSVIVVIVVLIRGLPHPFCRSRSIIIVDGRT